MDPPLETRDISEQLSRFLEQGIDVILEPSGTYGDSLQYHLQEIGCTLYISPKRVHDAAEIYDLLLLVPKLLLGNPGLGSSSFQASKLELARRAFPTWTLGTSET